MTFLAQATNEIIGLLGLHSDYSSLSEGERMKLLAEAISAPPPVDKVKVCLFHFLQITFFHRSHQTVHLCKVFIEVHVCWFVYWPIVKGPQGCVCTMDKMMAHLSFLIGSCLCHNFQELYKAMSEPSREVVELFFACADITENISQKSITSYVISMTRQASHVMEVCSISPFLGE